MGWHFTNSVAGRYGRTVRGVARRVARRARFSSTEGEGRKLAALAKKTPRPSPSSSGSGGANEILPDALPQFRRYFLLACPGAVGEESCFVGVCDEHGLGYGGGH